MGAQNIPAGNHVEEESDNIEFNLVHKDSILCYLPLIERQCDEIVSGKHGECGNHPLHHKDPGEAHELVCNAFVVAVLVPEPVVAQADQRKVSDEECFLLHEDRVLHCCCFGDAVLITLSNFVVEVVEQTELDDIERKHTHDERLKHSLALLALQLQLMLIWDCVLVADENHAFVCC